MQIVIITSILVVAVGAVVGESAGCNSTCNTTSHPIHRELDKPLALFVGGCFLLIVIVAVVCNALLIATILSVKRLHSVTHVFIVNLAIGDIITAVVTIPFDIDYQWRGHFAHGKFLCGVMQVSFFLSLPSSVINLCLLTVDRFISIQWPFRKIRWLGRRNIVITLVASWTYTFLVALFPVIIKPSSVVVASGYCSLIPLPLAYSIFTIVVNFVIPIIIIFSINILLFNIANNHSLRIRQLTRTGSESDSESSKRSKQSRRGSMYIGANMKAAKRLLLLVGVFVACWLFYIILVVSNISCGECHPRLLTWMGNVVNYSSVAINPVLYGLLNKAVRKEVAKRVHQIMRRCLRRQESPLSARFSMHSRSGTCNGSTQITKVAKDEMAEVSLLL